MTTDNFLTEARKLLDWWGTAQLVTVGALVLGLLITLAYALRRRGRRDTATKVTAVATLLGLGWSAQGMWDTAVHHYDQGIVTASVLFVVFEAMLCARMLRAHQYRDDYARRGRHVAAVWVIAVVMALVVASGEGWAQVPGRLAIPLLVAYGWYTDLTADDDPGQKPKTSIRWTLRRALLAAGVLEAGAKDVETIDRDRLRNRMTRLAFRTHYGSKELNDLFRRKVRLAKMKTLAEDADLAAVRARLARMSVDLMADPAPEPESVEQPAPEVHPVAPPQSNPPERVQPAKPADPDRLPQGVHSRDGRIMRSGELEADAILLMRRSIAQGKAFTIAELAGQYTPPLRQRKAEEFSAKGRRPVNGRVPDLVDR